MSIHSLNRPALSLEDAAPAMSNLARLERLRAEMNGIAREQTAELEHAIAGLAGLAGQIAEGGEAYSVGVREVSRRLSSQLSAAALTLEALRLRGL